MEGNLNPVEELNGRVHTVPQVDNTLTKEGYCADAKVTGDELKVIKKRLKEVNTSIASTVGYNNKSSGLASTNMQSAIDEVVEKLDDYQKKGMVEGAVQFRSADNGHGSVMKNHSESADYGTMMSDVTKDGKTAKISISAALNLFTFTDADGEIRDVHHEGTKPFGSYTGNGSNRTVSTKGIGRLAVVYSDSHLAFVTPKGAMVVTLTSGSMVWMDGAKLSFINRNLVIATTTFNTSGTEYHYQVI